MLVNDNLVADMLLRRIKDTYNIVIDVETSGLDWKHNHIVGYVITLGPSPDDTFYVPVRHAGGGNLASLSQVPSAATNWGGLMHSFELRLIPALINKHLIGHNISFDLSFLSRVGYAPSGPITDTMVQAFLLDELRPSLSLDACCKTVGVQEKKGDELYKAIAARAGCKPDRSSMAYFWQLPGNQHEVWDYACGDGTSTYQLWWQQSIDINSPYYSNSTREYTLEKVAKVEMELIPVLHSMSMRGVKINEWQLIDVTARIENDLKVASAAVGDINVRSPVQVQAYLEKNGVTDWPLTEKGSPSFPEEWLLKSPAGKNIVTVRKSRTLLDSFLKPIGGRYLYNGRVYPQLHQTRDESFGTRTGRMSITNPNLGAMPGKRQGELGKLFRSIFVPDDGMVFTEGDYAACEIRICAHYCKAKAWVDGFNSGVDPHTSVANSVGIIRRHAKTINLAIMTGSGKRAIAEKLGLSYEEGSRIVDQYYAGLPELKDFQKKSGRHFEARGFVSTLLGRRLQLEDSSKGYTAVNRLTQGGNADIAKERLVAMSHVPNIQLSLSVYDSVLFQHEPGSPMKDMALKVMADMTNIGLEVPMKVDYGSGSNWGEASFSEEGSVEWKPNDN